MKMATEEQEIAAFMLAEQIARMKLTSEADGLDLENDDAMDGLIYRARNIVAGSEPGTAEGRPITTAHDAAAMVRDALDVLDAVEFVDDEEIEDGQLKVMPAIGPVFRVSIGMTDY